MELNKPSGKMAKALFKSLIRDYEKAYYNKKGQEVQVGGGGGVLAQSDVIVDGGGGVMTTVTERHRG